MPNWQVRKWRKWVECLIFIANSVLVSLQCNMKVRAYLVDNYDLEDEMDEEYQAVNIVYDIVSSDVNKERHYIVSTCYITLW